MSALTRRQARLVKNQISKLYGRNYIPLITGDSTLSIGDVLLSKRDISPVIDSSVFKNGNTAFEEGKKVDKNIVSSAEVNLTTKFSGQAAFSEYFKLDESGIIVSFTAANQLFLKVQGLRQQSIKNFVEFRKELLDKYTKGEISSKVYIVRGLVYADKYYLQYSGNKGGVISLNLHSEVPVANAEASADFSIKWKKEVGYHVDGANGGVLGYRVSGVRLKRHKVSADIHNEILKGMTEADILDNTSFSRRKELFKEDALEIVDLTDEVLLAQHEEDWS